MRELLTADAVTDAAKKIEADLQLRGLSEGERYISAEEAGMAIGVSMATADRAMRILTEKGVLIRQRGRGTYVGPRAFDGIARDVKSVQILMPRLNESLGMSLDDAIRGVHKVYPDVPVGINVFSSDDPLPTFDRVMNSHRVNGGVDGFGLILAPRIIQEEVARRNLPAVLLGTPFSGVKGLVSIDIDHRQLGALLAGNLLERGHARFAMILRENVAPGDTAMLSGFISALGSAGIRCDALSIRHCVLKKDCVKETVRELFKLGEPPTALIGYPFPEEIRWVDEAAAQAGLESGKDFEYITGLGATTPQPESCPVRCCVPPDEVGERFGRLLAGVARGDLPEQAHTLLPVELK